MDPSASKSLEAAGRGEFVLQRCSECQALRYPIGNACASLEWEWSTVSGRGTIHSYEVVTQAIHPAFLRRKPYPLVLVELDEQRAFPGAHDALRVIAGLVRADGSPEDEERGRLA
jgi:uncharacterized OB-fold protein